MLRMHKRTCLRPHSIVTGPFRLHAQKARYLKAPAEAQRGPGFLFTYERPATMETQQAGGSGSSSSVRPSRATDARSDMSNVANAKPPGNGQAEKPKERPPWLAELRAEISALREEVRSLRGKNGESLLTKEDVADRLGVSPRTVDTLAAEGSLRRIKVRGCVRFHPDAVDAYVRRQAEGGRR